MKINILTLFPEYFATPLQQSILKRAKQKSLVEFEIIDIRDFATDKHQITDDRPYGGGAGMVLKIEPIARALHSLETRNQKPESLNKTQRTKTKDQNSVTLLTSAKGKLFTQEKAKNYSELDELTIICGHYGGVDERVAEHLVDEEIRIGDYVLTGGESAALVISDAVTRLLPGVLGNEESLANESHSQDVKFAHPVYTVPREFNGWAVPEVLLAGDHKKIEGWRENQQTSKMS